MKKKKLVKPLFVATLCALCAIACLGAGACADERGTPNTSVNDGYTPNY